MKGISTALVLTFLSVSGFLFAFRSAPAFAQESESCTVASPAPQAADVVMRVLDGIDGVARKIESIAPAAWEMMVNNMASIVRGMYDASVVDTPFNYNGRNV